MGRRLWFKVHTDKWLRGSIRDTSPLIRATWVDLLALASDGYFGGEGVIQLSDGKGVSDQLIARTFNISLEMWQEAKSHFLSETMIEVQPTGAIKIVNWPKYQSDYKKAYRPGKS